MLFKKRERANDDILGVDAVANVDELVKPPRPNWRRGHAHHELGKRFYVEYACCSPVAELGKPVRNRLQVVIVRKRAFEIIDPANPVRETVLLENGAAHDREVEMAVGIDETGHQDRIAEVFELFTGSSRARPTATILPPATWTIPSSMGGEASGKTMRERRAFNCLPGNKAGILARSKRFARER